MKICSRSFAKLSLAGAVILSGLSAPRLALAEPPVGSNKSDDGRAKNRRVELVEN